MDWFFSFLLFVGAFFVYLHTQRQFKTSEDLEIYETDYVSKGQIQKVCGRLQPTIFKSPIAPLTLDDVKATKELVVVRSKSTEVVLENSSAMGLLQSDTRSVYYSDSNQDVVSALNLKEFDALLQPSFSVTNHDMLFGSRKVVTPLMHHVYAQRFLVVQGGAIHVKMLPWKNRLKVVADYERFEFTSDVWKSDKALDFVVQPGYILFIPPYWWYTVQLDRTTCVTNLSYSTPFNILAHANHYFGAVYSRMFRAETHVQDIRAGTDVEELMQELSLEK